MKYLTAPAGPEGNEFFLRRAPALAQLLAKGRGVRNKADLPCLKIKDILAWADVHHQCTRRWPTGESGPIAEAPGETWKAVEMALFEGLRGLRGGRTIARLLRRHRLRFRPR
jgi:hypothetical protein